MTLSFQEYILQMKDDPEFNVFLSKAKKEYTWNKVQTPLLILIMAAGIFIFATQEEVYKKINELNAKKIVVHGKVVKASTGIMKKTWLHIQDGTGSQIKGTHNLVCTTKSTANDSNSMDRYWRAT